MNSFLGEYECTIDVKGRIMLPTGLQKQLPAAAKKRFVINRGFEKCLVLYPKNEWEKETTELNKLNLYVKENRDFIRAFHNGATELVLDGTNRLLLPKPLLQFASIEKDLVLFAFKNRIEVWSKEKYKQTMKINNEDFAALAEKVMGKNQ